MLPALVLTAGLGTRLDPITRLLAKPAVPLGGSTLVERVLGHLVAEGVREAILNLHHLPETITAIVGDGAHLGLRVRYSWEMPILGSAGGPRRALPLLDSSSFLIVNGDTLCDVELAPLVAAHEASGADVTMVVVPNPAPDRYNGVVVDAEDRVTGFVPRGHRTPSWHFVGVQVAQAALFEPLPDGEPAESVQALYLGAISTGAGGVRAHRVSERFLDVGTPADYLAAALALGNGATNNIVWPGAAIASGAELDACIVTDVSVPAGFKARRSILMPRSAARAGDRAREAADIMLFPIES